MNWFGWPDETWIAIGNIAIGVLVVIMILAFIIWRTKRSWEQEDRIIKLERALEHREYRYASSEVVNGLRRDVWEIKNKLDMHPKPPQSSCG